VLELGTPARACRKWIFGAAQNDCSPAYKTPIVPTVLSTFITNLRRIGHCWCWRCALRRKLKVIVGCFGLVKQTQTTQIRTHCDITYTTELGSKSNFNWNNWTTGKAKDRKKLPLNLLNIIYVDFMTSRVFGAHSIYRNFNCFKNKTLSSNFGSSTTFFRVRGLVGKVPM
jgi:hypothetical protein